jgi:Flp pilus assembly pilin Flp
MMLVKLSALRDREDGQDLVEYGLLVALIAVFCIAGTRRAGTAIAAIFANISSSLA